VKPSEIEIGLRLTWIYVDISHDVQERRRRHIGVEVWLHSFLASELDEGGRAQALAVLPPKNEHLLLI
jgi:hypothetical protein